MRRRRWSRRATSCVRSPVTRRERHRGRSKLRPYSDAQRRGKLRPHRARRTALRSRRDMTSATGAALPPWLEPMAATLTEDRFTGPECLFERKFDGIRLLAYKQGDAVQVCSRTRLPQHLPAVAGAIRALPAHDLVLDGELTWDGHSG